MAKGQEQKGPSSGMMNKASDGEVGGSEVVQPVDQQRSVNPFDQAQKVKIGSVLNSDAERYKKGPGPF